MADLLYEGHALAVHLLDAGGDGLLRPAQVSHRQARCCVRAQTLPARLDGAATLRPRRAGGTREALKGVKPKRWPQWQKSEDTTHAVAGSSRYGASTSPNWRSLQPAGVAQPRPGAGLPCRELRAGAADGQARTLRA